MELYPKHTDRVPQFLVDKYEHEARKYWDLFYKRNGYNFFKDRHYIDSEFPQVAVGPLNIFEVGCGCGNTIYPLHSINPQATIHCVDFSPRAIDLILNHPEYDAAKIHAFVGDVTEDILTDHIPVGSVDVCTMVFTLSAISPGNMPKV